ncbi:MAG: nucleotidyltransferase substrate binding protein [Nanoarchaeota archaeon]|nr:nucleotidyltransferase substrate binding protein [Nanoarchaeota archaeon]
MELDLTSLKKAIASLKKALNVATSKKMDALGEDEQEVIKAGVIQNFEFTYELCWKFIQRWIRKNRAPEDADYPRTRKELFRMAARDTLIEDPLPWFEYGDARNMTAHTYDEDKAQVVYEVAIRFVSDAQYLLGRLETMND